MARRELECVCERAVLGRLRGPYSSPGRGTWPSARRIPDALRGSWRRWADAAADANAASDVYPYRGGTGRS